MQELWKVAQVHGLASVAYGVTTDDIAEERPGIQAISQNQICMPLLEAGMNKADIRTLSQRRGLPTYDKPPTACLASRIPFGRPIRVENLNQVAQAEAFLKREFGLRQVRVRHYDTVARLEVEADDILRVAQPGVRDRIVDYLSSIGFSHVTLDLAGFRSGSMHEGLNLL